MSFFSDLWDNTELVSGFIGAVVGGGFTMFGSWFQTKSSNKAADLALARANAQRAFDTVTQFKIAMTSQQIKGIGTESSRDAWNREQQTLVTVTSSAVALLPNEHKATRSRGLELLGMLREWHGTPVWNEYTLATDVILAETLTCLGTFVRGSDVPEPRDVRMLIRQKLAAFKRTEAEQELARLEWTAEQNGLGEDDMARAERLREELGLPHPTPPADDAQNAPS
ncbi:hypothetical protein [Streptomyces sp. NPDC050507]|uniref:hypothetical protein n=1 Tax=Streptomyces sp. NPDC050507 TaxID=3365619 RepID=UPI0037A5CFD7